MIPRSLLLTRASLAPHVWSIPHAHRFVVRAGRAATVGARDSLLTAEGRSTHSRTLLSPSRSRLAAAKIARAKWKAAQPTGWRPAEPQKHKRGPTKKKEPPSSGGISLLLQNFKSIQTAELNPARHPAHHMPPHHPSNTISKS